MSEKRSGGWRSFVAGTLMRAAAHGLVALPWAAVGAYAIAVVVWAARGLSVPVPRYYVAIAALGGLTLTLAAVIIREHLSARAGVPRVQIVETSSGVTRVEANELEAIFDWTVTAKNIDYIPARADLSVGQRAFRGRVTVLGGQPYASPIPAKQAGQVRGRFRIPDDIGPAGQRLVGDVTLMDSTNHGNRRTIDFGEIPRRLEPKPFSWP